MYLETILAHSRFTSVAVMCLGAALAQAPHRATADSGDLRDLVQQFQSASSLAFWAELQMELSPSAMGEMADELAIPASGDQVPPAPVFGHIEYWASGDHYLIDSQLDPDRFPEMQTRVAYDGQRFQLLLSNGVLTTSAHESATIVTPVPNPLFELLQFRYALTDNNYQFELRLKDIQHDSIPDSFWNAEWTLLEDSGRALERAVFPGGVYEQRPYEFHVYVLAGERNRPIRIDRVAPDGRIYTSAAFSDYRRVDAVGGTGWWPHEVVLQAYDDQGQTAVKATYWLVSLGVDAPVSEEVFTIRAACAERVWDDDQRQFVEQAP